MDDVVVTHSTVPTPSSGLDRMAGKIRPGRVPRCRLYIQGQYVGVVDEISFGQDIEDAIAFSARQKSEDDFEVSVVNYIGRFELPTSITEMEWDTVEAVVTYNGVTHHCVDGILSAACDREIQVDVVRLWWGTAWKS